MKRPERALVLAAGFGTRLQPLTLLRPKPLVPVWGRPILRHVLELLRDWGVEEAVINLHHGAGAILNHIRLDPVPGIRCSFSFEPDILGTGGALRKAAWMATGAGPFWIMNADVLGDLSPVPLLRAFESHHAIAALWLDAARGPRTVEMSAGLIRNFRSAAPRNAGTFTFCGLQLVSPRLLRYLPETPFSTLIDAYDAAMRGGERVAGVAVPSSYWSDIGTPDDYRSAHRETKEAADRHKPGARFVAGGVARRPSGLAGFVSLGRHCNVAKGAQVCDSVLWDGVTLKASARVTNAIVADGVTVSGTVSHMAMRADTLGDPLVARVLRSLGWPAAATTVIPLPPRGSARTFTRLRRGRESAVLVRYSAERTENALYAGHARFLLKHGLRVPRVLLDDPDSQVCVLEDVGEYSLQDAVPALSPRRCEALYREAMVDVVALHDRATRAARRAHLTLCPPFTRHLYEWEQNLFCEQFLARHAGITPNVERAIRSELRQLIRPLLRVPQTLVHRDLQSSNILLDGRRPVLIDFQGMRFGAAAYDLASLLCDPYVRLPMPLRETLLACYATHAPSAGAVLDTFWIAAAERLVQALGAFGRLGALPGTRHFLRHIPAATVELRRALERARPMPALRETLDACLARPVDAHGLP